MPLKLTTRKFLKQLNHPNSKHSKSGSENSLKIRKTRTRLNFTNRPHNQHRDPKNDQSNGRHRENCFTDKWNNHDMSGSHRHEMDQPYSEVENSINSI